MPTKTSDSLKAPFPVQDVDGATVMFPAHVRHLMPSREDIPEEFSFGRSFNSANKWQKLTSDWFFRGLKSLDLTPKPGIDKDKALRHIRAILGSFEPKHEHKEEAVAFLLSQWFEDAKWEPKERK